MAVESDVAQASGEVAVQRCLREVAHGLQGAVDDEAQGWMDVTMYSSLSGATAIETAGVLRRGSERR